MREPDEFKRQAEKRGITFWESHCCTFCGIPVGTEIKNGVASYRSSCGCSQEPNHSYGWDHVAERYNMQDDERVIAEMDKFWGFDNE